MALVAILGLSAQGCGGGEATSGFDGSVDGGAGSDAAIEGPEVEVGQFSLLLTPPTPATPLSAEVIGSTTVVGTVGDKAKAEALIWEVASEAGDCRLLTPRFPFCDGMCGRNVCVEDNTCEPDRTLMDVGTVTVSGVTTTEGAHSLDLISVRNTYQNGLVEMPYPAFEAGDTITLSAAGAGSIAPFTIDVAGGSVLETPDVDYPLHDNMPLSLTWTADESGAPSRILVKLDISHHGGSKGKVECNVPDTGALTIPADMIADLLALGVAGFPSVVITRFSEDSAQVGHGRVTFQISEYAERWITVDGLISCTATSQCPDGQVCKPDKSCG